LTTRSGSSGLAIDMTLDEKQSALVEEITLIPDAYERLGHIVELGKQAAGLSEELRLDSFKIEGCMSQLWVVPEYKDGLCYFRSESDSAIVKGIASLLCNFYSEAEPAAIVANDASFLGEVGITQHLSPNRRNGLSRIVESIQHFAQSCLSQKS
jgi:cysteine desulfuration protein SufE